MTLIYFIAILGLVILIHEFGHFIIAKRSGVYCYEFSIGMGPKLFSFKGKKGDETTYTVRLLPIGGYVQMAGEEVENDESVPKSGKIQNKTFWQRFKIIVAGAFNNFILGIVLLFLMAIIYGSYNNTPYVGSVDEKYNASKEGIENGDLILEVNGAKVHTTNDVMLQFELVEKGEDVTFILKDKSSKIKEITVSPTLEDEVYIYGLSLTGEKQYGFVNSIKYTISEFSSMYRSMFVVIKNLITGGLGIDSLSGPVGIYNVIGQESKAGFENIIYLTAFISVNVGFVNLLPFPALDGGRALFLLIEKIRGKQANQKTENTINLVGFGLLMLLALIITVKDILNLF